MFGDYNMANMQGLWIDGRTGREHTVRDVIIEDGEARVVLSDGQALPMSATTNWVKCESQKEAKMVRDSIAGPKPSAPAPLTDPAPTISGPDPVPASYGIDEYRNPYELRTPAQPRIDPADFLLVGKPARSEEDIILDRAMSGMAGKLHFKVGIDGIDRSGMDMLMGMFGLEADKIAEYMLTEPNMRLAIKEALKLELTGGKKPADGAIEEPEPVMINE